VVSYDGAGIYFLDRIRPGVWRREVYPDAVPVRDPFEPPHAGKVVTRAISREWPMTVSLPDLGRSFTVQPVVTEGRAATADGGRFLVRPGVYVLSATGPVALAALPDTIRRIGFTEFYSPPPDTVAPVVQPLAPPELLAGRDAEVRIRIVDSAAPDSATLFLRRRAGDWYRPYRLRPVAPYEYTASVPGSALREGPAEFVVTVFQRGEPMTFPEKVGELPWSWDYYGRESWKVDIVSPGTPVMLFDPARDAARLAFTRIGDAGRRGLFGLAHSEQSGRPVFRFPLPVDSSGWSPDDYTASLVIRSRIRARGETVAEAAWVRLRLRGLGARQVLHVTLMEDDGTSWNAALPVDSSWTEAVLPLSGFTIGRGVLLPQGFPGQWNYWVGPAAGRGGASDRLRPERLERLQLSLRPEPDLPVTRDGYGVVVESVTLVRSP
jgi:hypothetical protein